MRHVSMQTSKTLQAGKTARSRVSEVEGTASAYQTTAAASKRGVAMDTAVRPSGCHGKWVPCCPSTSGRPHMQASSGRARQRKYPPVGRRWHSQQTCAAANVLQSEVASATDSDGPAQPLADGADALNQPGATCRRVCKYADKVTLTQTTCSEELLLRRRRRRASRQAGLRIHSNGAPVRQGCADARRRVLHGSNSLPVDAWNTADPSISGPTWTPRVTSVPNAWLTPLQRPIESRVSAAA